jgi:hypothetical protein
MKMKYQGLRGEGIEVRGRTLPFLSCPSFYDSLLTIHCLLFDAYNSLFTFGLDTQGDKKP